MSLASSRSAHGLPLLTTKLTIPPPRSSLVVRQRLIERLDEGVDRKLTLVSALPGSGKTTLLSAWAARGRTRVAWLSVDEGDNDPVRFLGYLVAAFQKVMPGMGNEAWDALQGSGVGGTPAPATIEAVLITLINELVAVPERLVLVLDDYHLVRAKLVHDAVAFFLDHLPPLVHLIISTRADPPLALPRLRARSELNEIHVDDLRFTVDEATDFFNECLRLALSVEDIALLESRTEGWIVGLQMAGLSLRDQSPPERRSFLASFAGDDRHVVDYLADEVLARLPDRLQSFLLETAILDRLSGSLCSAVTGQNDSQTVLERLERANLFVIPLDAKRQWYRYHHLFSDLLRHRLQSTEAERVASLHLRASQWYEQHGYASEAVAHALAAQDFARGISLIEPLTWELFSTGEIQTLVGWLEALPEEILDERPRLDLTYAWALIAVMQLDQVELVLLRVERKLSEAPAVAGFGSERDGEIQGMLGEVCAIRATLVGMRGDVRAAVEFGRQALVLLPEEDLRLRGIVNNTLGAAYQAGGDMPAATDAFQEAAALSQRAGNRIIAVIALGNLSALRQAQGKLHQVAETCHRALKIASGPGDQVLPVAGMGHVGLARLQYEWNELEAASEHVRKAIELGRKAGVMELVVAGTMTLARVLWALGNVGQALNAIDEAVQLSRAYVVSAALAAEVAAWRARLLVAQGDLEAGVAWVKESQLGAGEPTGYSRQDEYATLVRVLMTLGSKHEVAQLSDGEELLARLIEAAEVQGRMGHLIELLTLEAVRSHMTGHFTQAMAALQRALLLGEPEGYVRTFVDAGPAMNRLLRQARGRGIAGGYVEKLLAAMPISRPETMEEWQPVALQLQALVDPLSKRELEVLSLVAAGLSNREIARALVITVGTAKWHLHNIYGKLGVESRTQAIARARELALI